VIVRTVQRSPCARLFAAAAHQLLACQADVSSEDALAMVFPESSAWSDVGVSAASSSAVSESRQQKYEVMDQRSIQQQQQQQQQQQPRETLTSSVKTPQSHKFDRFSSEASEAKALSNFIDAIAAIPRMSLSRSRIADILLRQTCRSESSAAGTVLMQQGEVSSVVIYLVSGSVCVVQDGQVRASIPAPALVGHHSFNYARARTAAVVCDSRALYFKVDLDDLLAAGTSPQASQTALPSPCTNSSAAIETASTGSISQQPALEAPHSVFAHLVSRDLPLVHRHDARSSDVSGARDLHPLSGADAAVATARTHPAAATHIPALQTNAQNGASSKSPSSGPSERATHRHALGNRDTAAALASLNIGDSLDMIALQQQVLLL
jgi:CRP-like cAMP-binding protein